MKNLLLKITTLSVLTTSLLLASGWRLPESSSKSIALSGAYIANSYGADSTYYNPANMSFNKNILQSEVSLTYAILEKVKYKDNASSLRDGSTSKEKTLIPNIFISSKDYNNIRYGFSFTIPGGLTKRWESAYQEAYAQEFGLKILEFNPTMSYLINKNLSIGYGLRVIYTEGVVKSDGTKIGKPAIRDLEGNSIEYGYNLALAYKISNKSKLALTYCSNIDLNEEGNAKLYLSGTKVYDGGASVSVPLPAVFTLAFSHDLNDKTNIEFTYDKTYWSSYKTLDFEYKSNIILALQNSMDKAKIRNWRDTEAIRVGLTYKYNNKTNLLFGISRDTNPVPESSVSFESPDNKAKTFSTGIDYKLSNSSSLGFGYLLSKKSNRKVVNTNDNGTYYVNGEFSNMKSHLLSLSFRKSF